MIEVTIRQNVALMFLFSSRLMHRYPVQYSIEIWRIMAHKLSFVVSFLRIFT